uniref:Ku domain-containing protein n=2 Tax=Corethron hystrix TaxID=216773 RepID=A0A7S1FVX8_9STRA|mmetsp:Transcript_33638/g.77628  ORF Transcript_33638/g.77628 Transcript_33638/m.77628 type:complete len:225 (+) Transcript_33638:57-731(+)
MKSPPMLTILGYAGNLDVPLSYCIGAPYLITECKFSNRAQIAISALSQALHKEDNVAICRFVKYKDSDPVVGVLCPLLPIETYQASSDIVSTYNQLFFIQMPFVGELSKIRSIHSEKYNENAKESKVVDDLISSLLQSEKQLYPENSLNPCIQIIHETLKHRIISPHHPLIDTCLKHFRSCQCTESSNLSITDSLITPRSMLPRVVEYLNAYYRVCPLKQTKKK